MKPRLQYVLRIVGGAVIYALTVFFAQSYLSENRTPIFWIPGGAALAMLLLGGYQYWSAIFLGAVSAHLFQGEPLLLSAGIAVSDTIEVLLALWGLGCRRIPPKQARCWKGWALASQHDFFRLVGVAAGVSVVSAAVDLALYGWAGALSGPAWIPEFWYRWMASFLGVILVVPTILIWRQWPTDRLTPAKIPLGLLFLGSSFITSQIIFSGWYGSIFSPYAKASLMFVFVIWGAVCYGRHGVLWVIVLTVLSAASSVVNHVGYFADDYARSHLFNLWIYCGVLALGGLELALLIGERNEAVRKSQAEHLFLKEQIDSLPGIFYLIDSSFRFRLWNRNLEQVLACDSAEIAASSPLDFFEGTDRQLIADNIAKVFETGETAVEAVLVPKKGNRASYHFSGRRVMFEGMPALVGLGVDISERKRIEQESRLAAATFDSHEAILITDAQGNIVRTNNAFTQITGYLPQEVIGKNPRIMSSGRHDRAFYIEMWRQLLHTGTWSGEIWDKRKNGQVYPKWLTVTAVRNERQQVTHYIGIFSDITSRKQAEEEIRALAFYDALTKLPNRRLFLERFHAVLPASARLNICGGVMFIDLDHFKELNDTHGHEFGDLLLIEVAARIKSSVREMDTVARLGGDEFVVLVEDAGSNREEASRRVAVVAEKVREALARPYLLKEYEHRCSPSIGVCLYQGNGESVDTLLQHADLAMYRAKSEGRNTVRFFDPIMQKNLEERDGLLDGLQHATERQQMVLHYQIQVDRNCMPLGAEALLRWRHPQRGLLMPADFIPLAEESLLILGIGQWVLEQACQQLMAWSRNRQTSFLSITVNISPKQFAQNDFIASIEDLLRSYPIAAGKLKLELSEKMLLEDLRGTISKIQKLRELGVRLSMDDFGTVYSSLSYLKQLSSEQLKIEREVIRGITRDGNDVRLVQTIIDLAKSLDLKIFAEGVETREQMEYLQQHDCAAYQGYLFGKPLPLEEFEQFLRTVKRDGRIRYGL